MRGVVRAPRLAIVCRDAGGFGGVARHIVEHSAGLVKAGWDVTVVAERLDRAALEAVGAKCRTMMGWPWGSWLKRRLFAARADSGLDGFDLVHGHGDNFRHDVMSLHNCVEAAHEAIHGAPLPPSNGVARVHARQLKDRRFKTLICNSRQTAAEVERRFGVPRERIEIIYPGYDPVRFKPADRERLRALERARWGWGNDELVVGLVTSGDFLKRGVSVFLSALGKARRGGARFKAVVVGKEGKLGPYLKQAAEFGLADAVRFFEPRPDVERFYHALDIYALPALYEEFGQSVEEALACGLPVVVGARVGAGELLQGEMRDFIVEPAAERLAAALEKLLASAELRRRLAALGPGCAAAHSWEANVAATQEVYRRLLSSDGKKDKMGG